MQMMKRFDACLSRLCDVLGHADRDAPMREYCAGLMLPLKRKSVKPIAAHLDPQAVSAKHQSLLHFVGNSTWSDEACEDALYDIAAFRDIWGFAKIRYRGLAKNANRAFAMLAMLNLSKWGRPLTGYVRPVSVKCGDIHRIPHQSRLQIR